LTRTLRIAVAALLALAPVATAHAAHAGDVPTFTVGILNDVDSLNPFTGVVAEDYEIWGMMYDQLTGYAQKDFAPVPGLAESWQESADKKTWTYKIRSGVKWSDGQPVTARDAAYTFNRIIDGDYEQTNYGNYVANITKAEAPDDTTLVLTVSKPSPIMLRLAVPILPEHVWSKIDGKKVRSYSNEPQDGGGVGSGPFTLVERRTGQFIRLAANESYWDGAPHVKEVVFRIFNNADSLAQALRRGEIDFADAMEANVFNSLKDATGVTTFPARYSGFNELAINYGAALADGKPIGDGNPLLKDKRIRQAMAHAIDRETLVKRVLGGYGEPATTVIPPLYEKLHWNPGEATRSFDLAKANTILDDAGYRRGSDGVRVSADGKRLSFRLLARQESQSSQQAVQFIKGWFSGIGIETTVKVVSEDSLTEIVGQGKFDLFEWGWVVEPDPDYQLSTFTCGQRSSVDAGTIYAGLSDSFYCNPAYDRLYEQQAGETDLGKRAEIVKQMQQMLYDDVPYVVTYYYDDLQAYRSDRFAGFQPQPEPDGVLLFQYGTFSYRNIHAPAQAGPSSSSSGLNAPLALGGAAVVLLLVTGGVLFTRSRRGASVDDRE
jgi:peptide/nickel transport system substrate-binding protein